MLVSARRLTPYVFAAHVLQRVVARDLGRLEVFGTPAVRDSAVSVQDVKRRTGFAGLLEIVNSLPTGDVSQVAGPTWLAVVSVVACLCLIIHWIWRWSKPSRYDIDAEQEVILQRRLFDASSRQTGVHLLLLSFCQVGLKWLVLLSASLGIAWLLLKYVDTSYIIIGCFALSALVYDSQQNNVMKEGQKKLGIDRVP
mmetsp:Transcript_6041/g.9841  ORF Transcript_6041/g.9841 Transcript_6041/m.9841 type:complete len:197 (-) Transcript_6041:200-790(-)